MPNGVHIVDRAVGSDHWEEEGRKSRQDLVSALRSTSVRGWAEDLVGDGAPDRIVQ